ncbi:MAG: sporulation protein YtfJ [Clostridia bacterium]|nr:sporulation protein YtfJ [Clostridia bacterium]
MENNKVESVLNGTLNGLKNLVDVDTVIGEPVKVSEEITIIPISKVSCGFVSGGSGFGSQPQKEHFGGGAGGAMKVIPVCFLVIRGDSIRMLPVAESENTVDHLVDAVPEVLEKIAGFIKNRKAEKATNEE